MFFSNYQVICTENGGGGIVTENESERSSPIPERSLVPGSGDGKGGELAVAPGSTFTGAALSS